MSRVCCPGKCRTPAATCSSGGAIARCGHIGLRALQMAISRRVMRVSISGAHDLRRLASFVFITVRMGHAKERNFVTVVAGYAGPPATVRQVATETTPGWRHPWTLRDCLDGWPASGTLRQPLDPRLKGQDGKRVSWKLSFDTDP